MVEEIVHGLTHRKMTEADKRELKEMLRTAINALPASERRKVQSGLTSYHPEFLMSQGLTAQNRVVYYHLQNIDEFIAGAIRYPEVREFLKLPLTAPDRGGIIRGLRENNTLQTQTSKIVIQGCVQQHAVILCASGTG